MVYILGVLFKRLRGGFQGILTWLQEKAIAII
jgi:hypothetical protein